MLELSPIANAELDRYLRRFKNRDRYRVSVLQVIEMAANGCTIEEIENTVQMSRGNIGSAKRWGRTRGLC
jgi:alkyl sulfatase BDS1-like metallo-beta-lactamase superfamily hydrolase